MAEREQEREDYESKINELKQVLSRKSSQVLENEDICLKEVRKSFYFFFFKLRINLNVYFENIQCSNDFEIKVKFEDYFSNAYRFVCLFMY